MVSSKEVWVRIFQTNINIPGELQWICHLTHGLGCIVIWELNTSPMEILACKLWELCGRLEDQRVSWWAAAELMVQSKPLHAHRSSPPPSDVLTATSVFLLFFPNLTLSPYTTTSVFPIHTLNLPVAAQAPPSVKPVEFPHLSGFRARKRTQLLIQSMEVLVHTTLPSGDAFLFWERLFSNLKTPFTDPQNVL